VFALARADQARLTQDTANSAHAGGQFELKPEAGGAEAGALTRLDDLRFNGGRGLVGATMGRMGAIGQGGALARLKATQPLAHRLRAGAVEPGCRFDAELAD